MPKLQPHPHCTLDQEEGQGHPRIIELSAPQMQIEPLDEQLQIGGDMVKAQAEVVVKSLKKFKSKSLGGTPSILLTLFDQNRRYWRILPRRLSRHEIFIRRSLFPL